MSVTNDILKGLREPTWKVGCKNCKQLQAENQSFGNVLAVIHRDGGHYVAKHGHEKASKDAIEIIGTLKTKIDDLKKSLLTYGMHLDDCPCYIPEGEWKDNFQRTKTPDELNVVKVKGGFVTTVKCTCGYDEALKGE